MNKQCAIAPVVSRGLRISVDQILKSLVAGIDTEELLSNTRALKSRIL